MPRALGGVRPHRIVRTGSLLGFAGATIDIVNEANFPTWRALPGQTAVDLALRAAEQFDARVEGLSDDALAYAEQTGRQDMLDRSGHRNEHLDEIEAAFGMN